MFNDGEIGMDEMNIIIWTPVVRDAAEMKRMDEDWDKLPVSWLAYSIMIRTSLPRRRRSAKRVWFNFMYEMKVYVHVYIYRILKFMPAWDMRISTYVAILGFSVAVNLEIQSIAIPIRMY